MTPVDEQSDALNDDSGIELDLKNPYIAALLAWMKLVVSATAGSYSERDRDSKHRQTRLAEHRSVATIFGANQVAAGQLIRGVIQLTNSNARGTCRRTVASLQRR